MYPLLIPIYSNMDRCIVPTTSSPSYTIPLYQITTLYPIHVQMHLGTTHVGHIALA